MVKVFATIMTILTIFVLPIAVITIIFLLYRKTKKQETEIAVLRERLRIYESQGSRE